MDTEVLVVGAGPTGLVLALWLTRLGVRVRIVDRSAEAGTTSRAVVVQARTLEFYRQLGFADEVVQAGLEFGSANLWARNERLVHLEFGNFGEGQSPYPFALIFPQDAHERFLLQKLADLGVHVERNTTLESYEERGDRIVARVAGLSVDAAFIAGCDGAHSLVRKTLGLEFSGGTYEHLFYVADIEAEGALMNRELHVSVDDADFIALFPLAAPGQARLIGTLRDESAKLAEQRGWDGVSRGLLDRLPLKIQRVNWFSTYRVHHRVAAHFGAGRAFLLGDAAHVHSPVGGQGMNTGIGDAVNLAWKLAGVLRGRAPLTLLDSYELERIDFARRLIATTDRAFQFIMHDGGLAARVRVGVVPRAVSALVRLPRVRRFFFRTLSQTAIAYPQSPLSTGRAGRLQGGDRLPWLGASQDNFAPLASLGWQVHAYGEGSPELTQACQRRGLACHVFAWSERAAALGLGRDATVLVRPDGHVGFAHAAPSVKRFERYLDAQRLRFA